VKRKAGHKLLAQATKSRRMGPCFRRDDTGYMEAIRPHPAYAWPSVSNIAAVIASGADLPAQTTNWNDG